VTGFAKSTVHEIISDLNFYKVSVHWVTKMFTKEHKSKRMAASLENLCHYQDEEESFVESIVTGDETWVYEFSLESKRNPMTWKRPHSPTTKKIKIEPSKKKQWRPCSGIVTASCYVNFSHQKQSTMINTANLSKNCKNH
jgi:hypothetical protein